jgi:hypothetical protein
MSYFSKQNGITIGSKVFKTSASIGGGTPFVNAKSTLYDGVNDAVTLGQPANLNWDPDATEVTISCWFKPDVVNVQQYLVSKAKVGGGTFSYIIACNNDATMFMFIGGTNSSGGSISAGAWHHMAMTVRDVAGTYNAYLFLNGSQIATSTVSTNINNDVDWLIGASRFNDNTDIAYQFDGNIDEVTFWNSAFTNSDITNLYNAGAPANPQSHAKSANLLHWYRMGDGDTFPTITDQVGSANGTCLNMTSGAVNFVSDVP